MKRFIRIALLVMFISLACIFPIFMSPIRSIWDEQDKDHKKVAMVVENEQENEVK